MKKILLGCMLLMAGAGCPNPFEREGKDRPEPIGDPRLARPDPECQFCGAQGFLCCPKKCHEVAEVPLNGQYCLYNLRCLPVPDADGGEKNICVE
jgi:hypothetical protein